MHRTGHLGITMMFAAPIILALELPIAAVVIIPLFAFARIPDKDQHFDWIPGINHRGITHTFLFAIICGMVASAAVVFFHDTIWTAVVGDAPRRGRSGPNWAQISSLAGIGAFLGIFSHIIGDIITVGSKRYNVVITPYWPLSGRVVRFGWCYASNRRWNWGLLLLGIVLSGAALIIRIQIRMSQPSQPSLTIVDLAGIGIF